MDCIIRAAKMVATTTRARMLHLRDHSVARILRESMKSRSSSGAAMACCPTSRLLMLTWPMSKEPLFNVDGVTRLDQGVQACLDTGTGRIGATHNADALV